MQAIPMILVQILLPLYTNQRQLFSDETYENVRHTLTARFGGVTAYQRSPAFGHWKQSDEVIVRDDIVVFEVMLENLDRPWWANYREHLRLVFEQDKLIVRALPFELI
jgi:hypothetical protein